MIITGVQYAKNGAAVVVASKNTNAKATKSVSEMNLVELLEGLIEACDKEIASKNAQENV